jgi:hypothetical protein
MDGWKDGWMDGWMDKSGWMNHMSNVIAPSALTIFPSNTTLNNKTFCTHLTLTDYSVV